MVSLSNHVIHTSYIFPLTSYIIPLPSYIATSIVAKINNSKTSKRLLARQISPIHAHFIICSALPISLHTLSNDSLFNETIMSGFIHERKSLILPYISLAYVISYALFEKHSRYIALLPYQCAFRSFHLFLQKIINHHLARFFHRMGQTRV